MSSSRRSSPAGAADAGVDDVIAWYDSIAGSYDALYGSEQALKVREVLSEGLSAFLKDVSVIDVGCGTGLLTSLASAAPKYYIGIDLSTEMLMLAKRRLCNASFVNDLLAGDAAALPLRDGVADAVISISVFRARDDLSSLISECVRVCRDKCFLAYTVLCRSGEECMDLLNADEGGDTLRRGGWRVLKKALIRRSRELIVVLARRLPGVQRVDQA